MRNGRFVPHKKVFSQRRKVDFMYSLDEVRVVDAEVAQAIVDEQERRISKHLSS